MMVIRLSNLTKSMYTSEFYEADRWYSDPRFESPMITLHDGTRVFVGDIVTISDQCFGKVKKFMIEVITSISIRDGIFIMTCTEIY